jgi:RNA polymerase sigma factor (sigma-70 family)
MDNVLEVIRKYNPIWKILCSVRQKGKETSGVKLLKMARKVMDDDDIIASCYLGLCKAAKNYDPEKKVKFDTFACKGCYLELRKEVEKFSSFKGKNFKDWPTRIDYDLNEIKVNEDRQKKDISNVMKLFNSTCRRIIELYYGIDSERMTIKEISSLMGMSEPKVRRIMNDCIQIIKDEFEGKTLFQEIDRTAATIHNGRSGWEKWAAEKSNRVL